MAKIFSGLITALITPFDNLMIDEQGLIENINLQIKNRIDALLVLGSTGETPTLNKNEKKQILKIARHNTQNCKLIAGVGSYCTQETLENSHLAQDLGVDALLIVTPYYNKPTQDGLYQHFKTIASAVKIPIILYNVPGRTGVNISIKTLEKLADIPNIVGIKECATQLNSFHEIYLKILSKRPDFCLLTGDDESIFSTMAIGADGVISVASNLIPDKMRIFVDKLIQHNYLQARDLHYQLLPLFQALFLETNPIPIKTAMRYWDMPAGHCRLPLTDMQQVSCQQLLQVLDEIQVKV